MKQAVVVMMAVGVLAMARSAAEGASINNIVDPSKPRCDYHDDRLINQLLERIDWADKTLPNVPPEERDYLEKESASAQRTYQEEGSDPKAQHHRSNMMYANLQRRHFYPVWKLRQVINPARVALSEIAQTGDNQHPHFVTYLHNSDAERLQRATEAIFSVNRLGLAIADFNSDIRGHEFEYLSTDNYWKMYSYKEWIMMDLGYFMSCKLAKVMGPQKIF